jgi:APA family basic amino acid/polyamine antiporter
MKELSGFKRVVIPVISIIGSVFMIVAACFSHKFAVVIYLVIFFIIMAIGFAFRESK